MSVLWINLKIWRIVAFELWCWRLLRVPWTARRSSQSILKEISPEYSLEGLMRKLKLQYFGHLMQRTDSWKRPWCWGGLKVGGEGDDRGWDGWMASSTQWTWVWVGSRSWWWTGRPGMLQSMGWQRVRHDWATELNWTECFWDRLEPGILYCSACIWTNVSFSNRMQRNYKGIKITVCMQSWGKLWTIRYKKDQNSTGTKVWGAKAGYCPWPLHTAPPRRWADHLSHSSGQIHPPSPHFQPI